MNAPSLMIQGTTSDAGKSTLVAGLCRILKRRGTKVAPFKPQNMALNSAVTCDGGEIGRAQALQAIACGIEPHSDMNPVLIKPSSDTGAQIIIQGRVMQNMDAQSFHGFKPQALRAVMQSFGRLTQRYQTVVVEGAGSPAEINLREGDIANMGFAEEADCPVVLIADIDKGGVFAHLVGTLALLSEPEQARVVGFVINKFRGDITLLEPGLDWLEERTGKPVFGVIPYMHDLYLDAEDAIDRSQRLENDNAKLKIVVPVLSRISNHTDFDVLRLHPNVDLQYVSIDKIPPPSDLIILPGTKNVRDDLQLLKNNSWDIVITKHLRYGGKVMGICGGLQMLGSNINDPLGIESKPGKTSAFGLVPIETTLQMQKTLTKVSAELCLLNKTVPITGYEIHNGTSDLPKKNACVFSEMGGIKGYLSDDKQIFATYIHGLFDEPQACELLLNWAGLGSDHGAALFDVKTYREQQLDKLADTLEKNLDISRIIGSIQNAVLEGETR